LARDLELRRFSRPAVVAWEKGVVAEGVVYSSFPAGRGGEGVLECCIGHLFSSGCQHCSCRGGFSFPTCSGSHSAGSYSWIRMPAAAVSLLELLSRPLSRHRVRPNSSTAATPPLLSSGCRIPLVLRPMSVPDGAAASRRRSFDLEEKEGGGFDHVFKFSPGSSGPV
jgi:hypothetical protein